METGRWADGCSPHVRRCLIRGDAGACGSRCRRCWRCWRGAAGGHPGGATRRFGTGLPARRAPAPAHPAPRPLGHRGSAAVRAGRAAGERRQPGMRRSRAAGAGRPARDRLARHGPRPRRPHTIMTIERPWQCTRPGRAVSCWLGGNSSVSRWGRRAAGQERHAATPHVCAVLGHGALGNATVPRPGFPDIPVCSLPPPPPTLRKPWGM